MPGLKGPVSSAQLLVGGQTLRVDSKGNDKLIHLPATAPDPVVSVIRLKLDGPLNVDNRLPSPAPDGTIQLPLWMADIHNPGYGGEARLGEYAGEPAIEDWTDHRTFLTWSFETANPGRYEIVATLAATKDGGKLKLEIGKESTTAKLTSVESVVVLGALSILTPGVNELSLKPLQAGWQPGGSTRSNSSRQLPRWWWIW